MPDDDMTMTPKVFEGPMGKITEIILPPRAERTHVDQTACLSSWLLHAPAAHPIWPDYEFSLVHLLDIPGQSRPAFRKWADSSHEILLIALNPKFAPYSPERLAELQRDATLDESLHLAPLNMALQLRRESDSFARRLMELCARALVEGDLPIEPNDFPNGSDRWRQVVDATLEHLNFGGHPGEARTP